MIFEDEIAILQALINARGPCGEEGEVRRVCQDYLNDIVDEMRVDAAGNLIGIIRGEIESEPSIRLMVHMDEISLIVKRINEDGSLRVNPLGGILPSAIGQCPVDVMGDKECFSGILSFGSLHTTKETINVNKMLPEEDKGMGQALSWADVNVITRKTPQQLKEAGVHPGTRVVIGQERRQLFLFQDCIAGYFLDNRAAIVVCILALRRMRQNSQRPRRTIYFVATCSEEIGGHGGSYASRTLPGDLTLAIDVGPVAKEYQTVLSASPIIVYQDSFSLYDKQISNRLLQIGERLGIQPQSAIWENYGSDASLAQSRGQTAQAALMCFSVENTHGYEVMHRNSMAQCASLLIAYLLDPE